MKVLDLQSKGSSPVHQLILSSCRVVCGQSVRCSTNGIGSRFRLEGLLVKGVWDLTVIDQEKLESMVVDA